MIKSTDNRNKEKFGEFTNPDAVDREPVKKLLADEMIDLPITPTDYAIQGYRCYRMSDFDPIELAKNLPNIGRRHGLEIMVINDILYIKDTYKYDHRNPYTK